MFGLGPDYARFYDHESAAWVVPIAPDVLVSAIEAYVAAKTDLPKLQTCVEDETNRISQLPPELVKMIESEISSNTTLQDRTEMYECITGKCAHEHTREHPGGGYESPFCYDRDMHAQNCWVKYYHRHESAPKKKDGGKFQKKYPDEYQWHRLREEFENDFDVRAIFTRRGNLAEAGGFSNMDMRPQFVFGFIAIPLNDNFSTNRELRGNWAKMLYESDDIEPIYRDNQLDDKQKFTFERAIKSLTKHAPNLVVSAEPHLVSLRESDGSI